MDYDWTRVKVRLALTAIILKERPSSISVISFVQQVQCQFRALNCHSKLIADSDPSIGCPHDSGVGDSPSLSLSFTQDSLPSQDSGIGELPSLNVTQNSQASIECSGLESSPSLSSSLSHSLPPIPQPQDIVFKPPQEAQIETQSEAAATSDDDLNRTIEEVSIDDDPATTNPIQSTESQISTAQTNDTLNTSFGSMLSDSSTIVEMVKMRKRKCSIDRGVPLKMSKGHSLQLSTANAKMKQAENDLAWESGIERVEKLCQDETVNILEMETLIKERLQAIEKHLCSRSKERSTYTRRALVSDTLSLVIPVLEDLLSQGNLKLSTVLSCMFGKVLSHWLHWMSTGHGNDETLTWTETMECLHEMINGLDQSDTLVSVGHCLAAIVLEHKTWAATACFDMHTFSRVDRQLIELQSAINSKFKQVLGPRRSLNRLLRVKKRKKR